MSLDAGSKLGHYEITSMIGKGGMGEVYKAHDPRVGRDVAIKVSAQQFSERFDREVRAIAALNHPNICTLYDVGPNYLVMEFVEGESPKGPMALDEALRITDQIAAALEAAHDKGITHRDLKPANVMVKPDGLVKVLDFGLAKVVTSDSRESDVTLTIGATQPGAIMGTPGYMAPEQARGKPADKRADIWAFGVLLHELLTGERLFKGEDLTEVLASVVKDAPDLSVVPPRVRRLLSACLQKDPKKRLQSIANFRLLLDPETETARGFKSRLNWMPWAVATAIAIAAGVAIRAPWQTTTAPAQVRFEINAPAKTAFTNWMTLSPDGSKIAFTARRDDGRVRLWVRGIDSLDAKDIADTGANPVPFWSSDSRHLAYQIDGKLRRVEARGGPSQILCDVNPAFLGGAWNPDGVIVFGGPDGLARVSANGGMPEKLTAKDTSKSETGHAAPVFLPDGQHFLYQRRSSNPDNEGIYAGSLTDPPEKQSNKLLLATDLNALYAPTAEGGRLLFLRESALMAQPFDAEKLALSGEAVQIANPVGRMTNAWINAMVSNNGALTYRAGGLADLRRLVWYDRTGKLLSSLPEPATWGTTLALSPDGSRAAATRSADIYVVDLAKALFTKFTFDKAFESSPVWSPDGTQIVFSSEREGASNLYIKAATGATNEELLLKSAEPKAATSWSRDGRFLLYSVTDPKTGPDIWVLPMRPAGAKSEEAKPTYFLATQFSEGSAQFSPDGHYVAYQSNESGRSEVYVRSFPEGSGKWQISREGGSLPRWGSNGKELFFPSPTGFLMAVDVTLAPAFQYGIPRQLFAPRSSQGYAPAPDSQKFLAVDTLESEAAANPIIVVLNALR